MPPEYYTTYWVGGVRVESALRHIAKDVIEARTQALEVVFGKPIRFDTNRPNIMLITAEVRAKQRRKKKQKQSNSK